MILKNIFKLHFLIGLWCISIVVSDPARGQIRAGVGYLKMLPGARESGLMGTLSGALDLTYSFYANPAATGFLREWQWSATYTNWISDLYDASFLYGKNFRMPWSRWTRFVIGVNYLGIPEFNNVDEFATPVSGNNLLLTFSMGQPLTMLTENLSLGANIKYFSSKLASYEADGIALDVGLLFRMPRFTIKNPITDYLIFSAGLAVTNLGQASTFVAEKTPLPRTFRGGVALNIGAHHGFQMSLATDYRLVRDEDGYLTFGSELSWRQLISLEMGYSSEDNLLGHFVFGGSLRLDDRLIHSVIPGRNNALRLDLATNQGNDYFAAPYHGSITHQPICPENFHLTSPTYGENIHTTSVDLKWERTREPDLYDDFNYRLLVDQDSVKIARIIDHCLKDNESLLQLLNNENPLVNQQTLQTQFSMNDLTGGDYFWAVVAYDKDDHLQFGKMQRQLIAKFHVTAPAPKVIALGFDYHPWITTDDYQGMLKATIVNVGDRLAENFLLLIYDATPGNQSSQTTDSRLLSQTIIPALAPGEETIVPLEWHTLQHGLHQIRAEIALNNQQKKITHTYSANFYTIPKGTLATQDTVIIQNQALTVYDLPYVGKIFFDTNSAEVNKHYFQEWVIEPPLALFAKRLQENPTIKISLQGTIDPNSGEKDLSLAEMRAQAVQDTFYHLGVQPEQMEILPGIELPERRMPAKAEDARWALEERRYVDLRTEQSMEKILFNPLQTTYIARENIPVVFQINIKGVVPNRKGFLCLEAGEKDSLNIDDVSNPLIVQEIIWLPEVNDENEWDKWLGKEVNYSLTLIDTLQRQFKVRPQETYLQSKITSRERRYFVLARFESTEAFYHFYWSGLLDVIPYILEDERTRIRFIGHGCASGSEEINERLSRKRANDFLTKFLQDIQNLYPQLYEKIKSRIDPPQGFGEKQPFEIKTKEGKIILIGDDNNPLGRQLNRRVMVFFYTK